MFAQLASTYLFLIACLLLSNCFTHYLIWPNSLLNDHRKHKLLDLMPGSVGIFAHLYIPVLFVYGKNFVKHSKLLH